METLKSTSINNKLFSKAIFKNIWTKFCFIPSAVLVFLIMVGPFMLNSTIASNIRYASEHNNFEIVDFGNIIRGSLSIYTLPFLIACLSIIAVAFIFSYLNKATSTYMMHAFPVSRKSLLFTGYISGFLMIIIPMIIACVISMPIIANVNTEYMTLALKALLGGALELVFFYSLAVLLAMCTGSTLFLLVLYALVNVVYFLIYACITVLGNAFLVGIDPFKNAKFYLSPAIEMSINSRFGEFFSYGIEGWAYPIILFVVGIGLFILSFFAYQKRDVEVCGELAPYPWMRPILRWLMALFISTIWVEIIIGIGGFSPSPSKSLILDLVCFLVIGSVTFFICQMVLKRSFRVFNKRLLIECIAMQALFIVMLVVMFFDVAKIQDRIPIKAEVEHVNISLENANYLDIDEEDVDKVLAIHQLIIDNKESLMEQSVDVYSNSPRYFLDINYTYKNGKKLNRTYIFTYDEENEETSKILDEMAEIINTPKYLEMQFKDHGDPAHVSIDLVGKNQDLTTYTAESEKAAKKVEKALKNDIKKGNVKIIVLGDGFDEVKGYISLDYPDYTYLYFSLFDAKETIEAIQ